MKISDKAIGYISFAVIVLAFAGIGFGMWQAHRETSTQASIDFDELGSLLPEDPLTENGYEIGHVKDVKWLGDRSRVTVVFDAPTTLREGTRFRNAAFALMGQRRIELVRPRKGDALPKDYVFQGEFVPGITESLRFIEIIRDQAMQVRDAVTLLLSGNDSTPSMTRRYAESMQAVEKLLNTLEKDERIADDRIRELLDQADSASRTITKTADVADSALAAITLQADTAISNTREALRGISDGIAKIDAMTGKIENDPLAKDLLHSREKIDKMDSLVAKIDLLIASINTKEVALYDSTGNRVKLVRWKNLNLIGKTAREKARERQKK